MKKYPFYLIPLLLIFFSCAERQDFDQYDDLEVRPVAEASLLYVETPEILINSITTGAYYSQDFNFDAFAEEFVSERILDGVITYEVENTTSKELEFTVEFIDAGGNVLDTETFLIDPAPTAVLTREIAYGGVSGRNIEILTNTSGMRVTARNLGDNTSVSGLPDPKVIFRSSAEIRIRLK
jgi:hypothetical protein